MVTEVFLSALQKKVKLGRKPPVAKSPRLQLRNYLLRSLPPAPATCDYTAAASAALGRMYLNDQLGDCVIAGMAHLRGVLTGNARPGNPVQFTDAQVLQLYSAIGGYVPGQPSTDQGCNEEDALNYWRQYGAPLGEGKILGALAINPSDPQEVRVALWLFENLMFGLCLPDSWLADPAPGFVWDADRPNPQHGHCIVGAGYGPQGVKVSTWGMLGTITDRAMQLVMAPQFQGALYTVLSPEMLAKGQTKAPNGVDWSQLVADFDSLGGNVPLPPPVPVPVPPVPPVPVPPAPSSLQQQVDAVFAVLETIFASNPLLMQVLAEVQAVLDALLTKHQLQQLAAYRRGVTIPPFIVQLIDQAFQATAQRYPQYALLIGILRNLFDHYLSK